MREFYDRFMSAREWIDEHISIETVSGNWDEEFETAWHLIVFRINSL